MKTSSLGVSVLVISLLAAAPALAQSTRPPPNYNFTTKFRGPGMCLDVYTSGPKNNRARMTPCAGTPSQTWQLVRATGGAYHLTTLLGGPGMCLGVIEKGPGANNLGLAKCADTASQNWTLRTTNGAMKMTSTYKGGICAEVINGQADDNDIAFVKCANTTGQIWDMGIAAAPAAKAMNAAVKK